MPRIPTELLAGLLNEVMFVPASDVSAKVLSGGIGLTAVGLLLPLVSFGYLKHTDAVLVR